MTTVTPGSRQVTGGSFLDRLRARMDMSLGTDRAGIFGTYRKPAPKERHSNLVQTNRWDEKVWKAARPTTPIDNLIEDLDMGDTHKGGEREGFEGSPELVKAVYNTFWKAAPKLTPKREVKRDLFPARRIVEEMMDNPKLKDLQGMTSGDAVMATIAVDAMGETLREILTRVQDVEPPGLPGGGTSGGTGGGQPGEGQGEGSGKGGKGNRKEKEPKTLEKGANTDGGGGKGEISESEKEDGEAEDLTEDAESDEFDPDAEDALDQEETDWEEQFDAALDELDLDVLANRALDAATAEVAEIEMGRKGIGLEDGEWYSMNPESRMAMAAKLRTQAMKELAEVIGRMKRFALGVKATRINDVPHEAYDVEMGNDLRRVLRPQFALLGTPETSYEFYRRFVEKELLQFKMRGTEDVGKGPIVICIDKSGSMGGRPFQWAMGVAEALRRFAAEEDRDYYAMFFGNNNDRERFMFPKGKGPFDKVLSFLGTQANGGTQFDGVLTEALEYASKGFDDEGKGKADIVFITDGCAHLEQAWIDNFNAERKRIGVRMYSVYIGGSYDYGHTGGPLGLLTELSDAAIPVSELSPESVREVFAKV